MTLIQYGIFESCSGRTSQFFPIQGKEGCTPKLLPVHERVGKLGYLRSPLYLSDCEDSLSGTVCLLEREKDPIKD